MSIENFTTVEAAAAVRWADWVARGAAQSKTNKRRMRMVFVAAVSAIVIGLATVLSRG